MTAIYINKREFVLDFMKIEVENLRYWPENPRIYGMASQEQSSHQPSELQTKIEENLCKRDRIRELRSQIIEAGGLIEPLLVKESGEKGVFTVIEGNSRLAACRLMLKSSDRNFNQIASCLSCNLIPNTMTDDDIVSYLSHLHVQGKLSWGAYENACFIKRALKGGKVTPADLQKKTGIKSSEITRIAETLDLMEQANETETNKFSYYRVAMDNPSVRSELKKNYTSSRNQVIGTIRNYSANDGGEDDGFGGNAQSLRNHFRDAAKSKTQFQKYMTGKTTLSQAAEQAINEVNKTAIPDKLEEHCKWFESNMGTLKDIEFTDPNFASVSAKLTKLARFIQDIETHVTQKKG